MQTLSLGHSILIFFVVNQERSFISGFIAVTYVFLLTIHTAKNPIKVTNNPVIFMFPFVLGWITSMYIPSNQCNNQNYLLFQYDATKRNSYLFGIASNILTVLIYSANFIIHDTSGTFGYTSALGCFILVMVVVAAVSMIDQLFMCLKRFLLRCIIFLMNDY